MLVDIYVFGRHIRTSMKFNLLLFSNVFKQTGWVFLSSDYYFLRIYFKIVQCKSATAESLLCNILGGTGWIDRLYFITNNTAKIQLKTLGRCFGSHLVPLSTLKAYVMLAFKPWCKKKRKLRQNLKSSSGSRVKSAEWKGWGVCMCRRNR